MTSLLIYYYPNLLQKGVQLWEKLETSYKKKTVLQFM